MVHWFDLFVGFFLFASAIWSYFRGFAREVISVSSLIAGYFVASRFYEVMSGFLEPLIKDKILLDISSFALLFFITVILTIIVGASLRRVLTSSKTLHSVDRVAGITVGLVKGVFILALIAYPLSLLPGTKKELMEKSVTAPYIIAASSVLIERFTPGLAKSINDSGYAGNKQKKVMDQLRDNIKKLESGAKSKADVIRETVNSVLGNGIEKNGITEKDQEKMDELLKRVDSNDN